MSPGNGYKKIYEKQTQIWGDDLYLAYGRNQHGLYSTEKNRKFFFEICINNHKKWVEQNITVCNIYTKPSLIILT